MKTLSILFAALVAVLFWGGTAVAQPVPGGCTTLMPCPVTLVGGSGSITLGNVGVFGVNGTSIATAANPFPVATIPPATYYTDTTTALLANATFTGTTRTLPTATGARYFYASVYSDQGSAANGFQILAYNGTGYVVVAEVTSIAATPSILQVPLIYASYKVQMINGATNQTTLWVQSGFAN